MDPFAAMQAELDTVVTQVEEREILQQYLPVFYMPPDVLPDGTRRATIRFISEWKTPGVALTHESYPKLNATICPGTYGKSCAFCASLKSGQKSAEYPKLGTSQWYLYEIMIVQASPRHAVFAWKANMASPLGPLNILYNARLSEKRNALINAGATNPAEIEEQAEAFADLRTFDITLVQSGEGMHRAFVPTAHQPTPLKGVCVPASAEYLRDSFAAAKGGKKYLPQNAVVQPAQQKVAQPFDIDDFLPADEGLI